MITKHQSNVALQLLADAMFEACADSGDHRAGRSRARQGQVSVRGSNWNIEIKVGQSPGFTGNLDASAWAALDVYRKEHQ